MISVPSNKRYRPTGFSLIELLVAIIIVAIPIIAVGALLVGSTRGWQKIYNDTNSRIRQDAAVILASLQTFGRQANIANYTVYKIKNGVYSEASPDSGETVAKGVAVEFRYWQDHFDPSSTDNNTLEYTNTGTHYVLYYLDGTDLKVDFGEVVDDVGAIYGSTRYTENITSTQTLTSNVDITKTPYPFSHVIEDDEGSGCVNTYLTLTDEDEDISIDLIFATMLRSAWPR